MFPEGLPPDAPDERPEPCGACGEPATREGHFYICRNRACRCWHGLAPLPRPDDEA
jgi:hypothetical protein